MKISAIDSHYRLYREKTLELREGEQLRASAGIHVRAGAGEMLTVTGLKQGKWLFKDKLVMSNSRGEKVHVNPDAPLYADYGYTESFGATRREEGSVIAVLSGRDVSDATINMLKRSGDNVTAFTSLDEHSLTKRLEENKPLVTITGSLKSLSGQNDLTDALRALGARKMSLNEREVRLAIEKVTGTSVTFSETAVRAEIATDNVILAENLSLHMSLLQKRGEIIPLSPEQGAAGLFISRDNFDNELTILRHVAEGKNAVSPLIAGGLTAEQSGRLTDGQRQAADLILTSRDRIIGIQGYAGVGKTTQFRTVATAVSEMDNPPVIAGLAPTHRAVSELNGAGIPAQTIASFLSENSQWQEAGEARDYSNTLFVIDESSMNGNAQMASLLTVIAEGGGRAVLSGDKDQLKSLESGAPFALTLDRSAADVAVMKEIVRQTPALRPAVEAIIAGNVKEALSVAEHVSPEVVARQREAVVPESSVVDVHALQVAAEKQAIEEGAKMGLSEKEIDVPRIDIYSLVADDYAGRTPEARDNTLIITPLNSDRQRLNEKVHEKLIEQRVLDRDESTVVNQLIRVGNSNADLGRRSFWTTNRDNTVRIGEKYYKVGESDQDSGIVRMHGLEGADDRWLSPPELRKESVAVYTSRTAEISTGEKIRLTATDRERGIMSSDKGTVTGVTKDGQITLDTGGRTLTLNPNRSLADQHMDYGYAVTNYSSQGASVDYVIALASTGRMATLDNAYVQLSRTKEHVQVYAQNLQRWTKQVESNSGKRETGHDVVMRAEDNLAEREVRLWDKSQPVADTRLAQRTDSDLMADARFLSGKTPEIIWPVINENGRQRGNWHVPVSPATGQVDFSQAHYEGAGDGNRIVLQRGEKHGEILQAEDIRQALTLMDKNPDSPVILSAGRTEESETRSPETAGASAGEELQVKDEEALERAIRNTLGTEEKEEQGEQRGAEEYTGLKDSNGGEKDRHGLADNAERELEDSLLARYGQDKTDDVLHDRDFRSDEVNIVRHERVHTEPEPKPAPQKTLE
nr:AAA family ATPase [Erwinia sp. S43]